MTETTETATTPTQQPTPEQIHESNKATRRSLAFAHFVLKNRCQFMHEEFVEAATTIQTLEILCHDLQAKIEIVEPPTEPKTEPKKPYVMEVPTSAAKVQ